MPTFRVTQQNDLAESDAAGKKSALELARRYHRESFTPHVRKGRMLFLVASEGETKRLGDKDFHRAAMWLMTDQGGPPWCIWAFNPDDSDICDALYEGIATSAGTKCWKIKKRKTRRKKRQA
jgi:hypothetical protein